MVALSFLGGMSLICGLAAIRELYIREGISIAERHFAVAPTLEMAAAPVQIQQESTPKPLPQPAPIVEYVTSEANVALMASDTRHCRLPAHGEITYGIVVAFRNRGSVRAFPVAHLVLTPLNKPDVTIHVHAAAWVGRSAGGDDLHPAATGEVILAVRKTYGDDYYCPDAVASGATRKDLLHGKYLAILELDVRHAPVQRHEFVLDLTTRHYDMACTYKGVTTA